MLWCTIIEQHESPVFPLQRVQVAYEDARIHPVIRPEQRGTIQCNGTELEDLPVRSGGDNPGPAAFLRLYLPDNAVVNKD